jgi:nicotinate-nucleotide adenylyltransferase
MEQLAEFRQYLKEHLSTKRFQHSVNVSEACADLAERFGGVTVEKARFAGLVHDICKEEPQDVQYTLMMRSALQVCEEERKAFKVWHGIAGAELLRGRFGITDGDVLNAVRFHTIGRAGMSPLEQIVYLGDMISAERDYPDVELMRKTTRESLNEGMRLALQLSLQKLLQRKALIPHHTVEAYNQYQLEHFQQEG